MLVGDKKPQEQPALAGFGQLPISESASYKRLQQTKTALEQFMDIASKRKKFSQNSNVDELHHRIAEIENEISFQLFFNFFSFIRFYLIYYRFQHWVMSSREWMKDWKAWMLLEAVIRVLMPVSVHLTTVKIIIILATLIIIIPLMIIAIIIIVKKEEQMKRMSMFLMILQFQNRGKRIQRKNLSTLIEHCNNIYIIVFLVNSINRKYADHIIVLLFFN